MAAASRPDPAGDDAAAALVAGLQPRAPHTGI
jgi:hypothetical protein